MFAFSFLEVTTGGAVPLRPPARHFLKDRGSDQETIAGTPPCKGAESGGVVWGPSAGAERATSGEIFLRLFFFAECHMSFSARGLQKKK